MNNAIVTGASSGIGKDIALYLIKNGFNVLGLSRSDPKIDDPNFKHHRIDLSKTSDISKNLKPIINNLESIDLLVHSAGFGLFGHHETLNIEKVQEMIDVNLSSPIKITSLCLRKIKMCKGTVIFISSITARISASMGSAYAATKAGISSFASNLFEENRKYGVKISNILPDITDTPFYNSLNFKPSSDNQSFITTECIVNAVEMILKSRVETVITEVVLRPQRVIIDFKR